MTEVLATLNALAVPIQTDPLDAMLGQLAESAGLVDFLRERCNLLNLPTEGDLVTDERLAMHPYWIEWREESERMVKFGELLVRAGFQERQVRVVEEQATLFADLMRNVFDDPTLGLSEAQRQTARRIAASQLRLVGGSSESPRS